VNPLPDGILTGAAEGCAPLCSDYKFSTAGTQSVTSTWFVNKRPVGQNSFRSCFYDEGQHTISGNLENVSTGCKNTMGFEVNVYPLPVANFEYAPFSPVENFDEVIFTNSSEGEEQTGWTWSFKANGFSFPEGAVSKGKSTLRIFKEEGFYPVALQVKNIWGCSDTVVKIIKVEPDFQIYVPNVFTPNGDEHNEIFLPVARAAKVYNLQIFDRWGQKIFESTDLQTGWDGFFRDEPCQQGVYSWTINMTGIHGEQKKLAGHVTLLR
jgi:gliding motility-associated-like protein